jgi:AraC family transcriptional regulator
MKPRIVERGAFHVVGIRERFTPGAVAGIPLLWERFVPRMEEVAGRAEREGYGVCECAPDAADPRAFNYTACVGVAALPAAPPEGMVAFTVPGGTFAVFEHRGPIAEFGRTVEKLWREWLPASGLKPTGAPDFESYDERFHPTDASSVVEIFVPVAAP